MQIYEGAVKLSRAEFDAFWALKPGTRSKNKIYGKEFVTPREQLLYAVDGVPSYSFSNISVPAFDGPTPEAVAKCVEFSKRAFPDVDFNGALVNWYADGNDYIARHSDDETDMHKGKPICSFSFGFPRTFRVTSKADKTKTDLQTTNGSCVAMMGRMQDEYWHEITKITSKTAVVGKRINVTVRAFKSQLGMKRAKTTEETKTHPWSHVFENQTIDPTKLLLDVCVPVLKDRVDYETVYVAFRRIHDDELVVSHVDPTHPDYDVRAMKEYKLRHFEEDDWVMASWGLGAKEAFLEYERANAVEGTETFTELSDYLCYEPDPKDTVDDDEDEIEVRARYDAGVPYDWSHLSLKEPYAPPEKKMMDACVKFKNEDSPLANQVVFRRLSDGKLVKSRMYKDNEKEEESTYCDAPYHCGVIKEYATRKFERIFDVILEGEDPKFVFFEFEKADADGGNVLVQQL